MSICIALEAIAPTIEIPMSDTAVLPIARVARIASAATMVPTKLKSATYEKSVPDTMDIPTTFAAASTIYH